MFIIVWVGLQRARTRAGTSAMSSPMCMWPDHAHAQTHAQNTASNLWGRRAAKSHPDPHISSTIISFGIVPTAENHRHITQAYTF